jgi:hypothetical protein
MTPTVQFLIGAPIVGSEASFLRRLAADLKNQGDNALILANFEVPLGTASRQIDAVVITPRRAELVEEKALSGPVSGHLNGSWQICDFSGTTHKLDGNPWVQAKEAKLALNDVMRDYQRRNPGVPLPVQGRFFSFDACVCIYPALDPGSKLPKGNFKAWIRSYPELVAALHDDALPPNWSMQDWYSFAIRHLHLHPVSLEGATDPAFAAAQNLLEGYQERLGLLVMSGRGDLLQAEPHEMCGENLVQRLLGPRNYLLLGRSGAGKSHHLAHLVAQAVHTDEVPIPVEARHYRGTVDGALSQNLNPCIAADSEVILQAVKRTGRRPLFVVDGLNYCNPDLLKDLLHDLLSLQMRYGARIVAASQVPPDLPGGLSFEHLQMAPLRLAHKEQIFRFHSKLPPLTDVRYLCESFQRAYDLEVVAKSYGDDASPMTRSDAYERYVRELAPRDFQSVTATFLRECAAMMDESVTYVLRRDDFDRFAEAFVAKHKVSLGFLDALGRCQLLVRSNQDLYFEHDLLRDYLAAEALRRQADDIKVLAGELVRPKHQPLVEFLLPRFSTPADLDSLLESVHNAQVLADGLHGHLGTVVQDRLLSRVLSMISVDKTDLKRLQLHYQVIESTERGPHLVQPIPIGVQPSSNWERTLWDAVMQCLDVDSLRASVLDFLVAGEQALRAASDDAARKLGGNPTGAWADAVRMFGILDHSGAMIPFAQMLSSLRRQFWNGRDLEPHFSDSLMEKVRTGKNADFALLVLLRAAASADGLSADERIALFFIGARSRVYWIRAEAVHLIFLRGHQIRSDAPHRIPEIVERLEQMTTSNPLTNTFIFEALAAYGALEPPVSVDTVAEEIAEILDAAEKHADDTESLAERANRCISGIFEDVYQNVYHDAFEALNELEQVKLLGLASSSKTTGMHNSWILWKLVQLANPQSLEVFRRFAAGILLPTSMPQESVAAFLFGVAGCAKLQRGDYVTVIAVDLNQRAWQLIGRLLFFYLARNERMSNEVDAIWTALAEETPLAIADVIYQINQTRFDTEVICGNWDLPVFYPRQLRPLLEQSLLNRKHLTSVFPWGEARTPDVALYAIQTLGRISSIESVQVLKSIVDDPVLGSHALAAIRNIESARISPRC